VEGVTMGVTDMEGTEVEMEVVEVEMEVVEMEVVGNLLPAVTRYESDTEVTE
jgi:hypothetical protein